MNDRAAYKFADPDFITITDYMNARSMFFDLGGHLSRCVPDEFQEMNRRGVYTESVTNAVAAYVTKMPACSIFSLAKKLKGYDTLWQGFTQGFAQGLKQRHETGSHERLGGAELAKLIVGSRKYPELERELAHHLTLQGIKAEIKNIAIDRDEGDMHAVALRKDSGNAELFVVHEQFAHKVGGKTFMSSNDHEIEARAHKAFPAPAP